MTPRGKNALIIPVAFNKVLRITIGFTSFITCIQEGT